jgi:hypothetical protein
MVMDAFQPELHYSLDEFNLSQGESSIRVFVNSSAVDLPENADALQAVRAFDPALEGSVTRGAAFLTDGRGIEIDPTAPLASGSILRVVIRSRRGPDADA